MKSETPANGIMKKADYDDAKWYRVECDCGSENHSHDVWIEYDCETKQIMVDITTESKTDWWSSTMSENPRVENETLYWILSWSAYFINEIKRRSVLIWRILFRGYIKYHSEIILNEQQAINYAETIKKAVKNLNENQR